MENNLGKKLPEFEPDLPTKNIHNREAAKARNLVYDFEVQAYVDEDGCLIRDEYGQQL